MREKIIVALDTPDFGEAAELGRKLEGAVGGLKVGLTLFSSAGPDGVRELVEMGFDVFLDLKLHDIPHQVAGATRELVHLGASMFTVHAFGGREMVEAAVKAAEDSAERFRVARPAVLAVTVLTSLGAGDLGMLGVSRTPEQQVVSLAEMAWDAGADGVVCSPLEVAAVRPALGPDALIVVPGVRPTWAEHGDQERVATPEQALASGASRVVIGRPITGATDPVAALDRIVEEME